MALTQAPKDQPKKDQSGIALFMVIASISVLSILVTEFTYIAQVNQKMAFDGLDQLKAHYLAKTGLKISLLRLKAYQNVKQYASGMAKSMGGGDAATQQLKPLLDKIWNFPFYYPFPSNLPGMTPRDKDQIKAFEKASGLEGKFSAFIISESSNFNLNSILPGFSAPEPSANPSATPAPTPGGAVGQPSPSPSPAPTASSAPDIKPEDARNALHEFLTQLLAPKLEADPVFADQYRDPHLIDDLMDNIVGWADRSYERHSQTGDIPMKRAPFYSISELHMIPGMDDDLYNLFAPNLTVTRTTGINMNTMKDTTVKAFFPLVVKDELDDFFKFRDSEDQDNTFKSEDELYKYIKGHFIAYERGDILDKLKQDYANRRIHFVVEESEFKITVQAQVNQSTRLIEAWVTLNAPKGTGPTPGASGTPPNPTPPPANSAANNPTLNGAAPPPPDPGVKIHFMRVL